LSEEGKNEKGRRSSYFPILFGEKKGGDPVKGERKGEADSFPVLSDPQRGRRRKKKKGPPREGGGEGWFVFFFFFITLMGERGGGGGGGGEKRGGGGGRGVLFLRWFYVV